MDLASDRYYRNSGAVPFGGTLLMLACGAGAALALSVAYALIDAKVPYVALVACATFVFGVGVGGAVRYGARQGRVRNRLFSAVVAATIGLLAVYFTWIWFVWLIFDPSPPIAELLDPSVLSEFVRFIADRGFRQVGEDVPRGAALYALWLAEAAVIVVGAIALSIEQDRPYCEHCQRWTEPTDAEPVFATADLAPLRAALEEERYEEVEQLRRRPADPDDCLRGVVRVCPECQDSNYLTVTRATATLQNGQTQIKHAVVIDRIRIPHEAAQHLAEPTAASESAVITTPPDPA